MGKFPFAPLRMMHYPAGLLSAWDKDFPISSQDARDWEEGQAHAIRSMVACVPCHMQLRSDPAGFGMCAGGFDIRIAEGLE